MKLRLDDDSDSDDPTLSLINLIDIFLVLIAALLLAVANNPLNAMGADNVTMVRNPGADNMEIIVKQGGKIEQFRAEGEKGQGRGVRVGSAYRMSDGSLVWVPDGAIAAKGKAAAGTQAQPTAKSADQP